MHGSMCAQAVHAFSYACGKLSTYRVKTSMPLLASFSRQISRHVPHCLVRETKSKIWGLLNLAPDLWPCPVHVRSCAWRAQMCTCLHIGLCVFRFASCGGSPEMLPDGRRSNLVTLSVEPSVSLASLQTPPCAEQTYLAWSH